MELLLYLVISSLIFGIVAHVLINQLDSHEFITNRQNNLADTRQVFKYISRELMRLETADFISISPTDLQYFNQQGQASQIHTATVGNQTGLFLNNDLMYAPLQNFAFTYLDANDNVINNIDAVRKIRVEITTEPRSNEGSLTLQTTIVPRNFVYANYQ